MIKDTILRVSRFIRQFFYVVIILVIVLIGLSFALLNSEPVTFNYYVGKVNLELSLILVITLAVGALLGVAASFGIILKSRRDSSKVKKEMKNNTKELNSLRSMSARENQ
ncbi:MAG: LapA family protein [Gammaproteobacteria bacterium]|nr:LapA family protein [Gammaproteobacteria bacterium]